MNSKTEQQNTQQKVTRPKILSGVVVSDKMKDTAVVLVERFVKDPKYQKYISSRKRYKAHDAGNKAKVGNKVVIQETRPISKDKRFKIIDIK